MNPPSPASPDPFDIPATLPDARHEAFAFHVASGYQPGCAYTMAGFSGNNARSRGRDLLQEPNVRDRAAYLRTCLPRMTRLRDRFAPSLILMPETQDQMLAWLWQVMNGTRRVLPLQLRAATLFARMKGWHLTKPLPQGEPAPAPTPLVDDERQVLAALSAETVGHDLALRAPSSRRIVGLSSDLADIALVETLRKIPSSAPATSPPALMDPQESPSQTLDPQPMELTRPQHGEKSASSPSQCSAHSAVRLPSPAPSQIQNQESQILLPQGKDAAPAPSASQIPNQKSQILLPPMTVLPQGKDTSPALSASQISNLKSQIPPPHPSSVPTTPPATSGPPIPRP